MPNEIPPSVTVTELEIKAFVVMMDAMPMDTYQRLPEGVSEACVSLLHKLEFAMDNKLRLSGKMRVIHIERDDAPLE